MRAGYLILIAAVGMMIGIAACPPDVRADLAKRASIPDHVVVEAERQLDMFVAWARNESANTLDETPVLLESADEAI